MIKKIFLTFFIVGIIALLAFGNVKIKTMGKDLEILAANYAKKNGFLLSISDLEPKILGGKSKKATVTVPMKAGFFNLDLDNLDLNLSLLKIFFKTLKGEIHANSYEGNFSSKFNISPKKVINIQKIVLRDLKLGNHPQLGALGIRRGKLSLLGDKLNLNLDRKSVNIKKLNLNISEFFLKKDLQLKPPLIMYPITLPNIEKLNISLKGNCEHSFCKGELNSNLNLGKIYGDLSFVLDKNLNFDLKKLVLNITVSLTDLGVKEIGTYLQFISPAINKNIKFSNLSSSTKKFRIIKDNLGFKFREIKGEA